MKIPFAIKSDLGKSMLKATPDWLFGMGAGLMEYINDNRGSLISEGLILIGAYFWFRKRHFENSKLESTASELAEKAKTAVQAEIHARKVAEEENKIRLLQLEIEVHQSQEKVDAIIRERTKAEANLREHQAKAALAEYQRKQTTQKK